MNIERRKYYSNKHLLNRSTMFKAKPYSNYILIAIETIKIHIDKDPFCYKKATELLDHLCTPHRNIVEKAFKDVYNRRIKEYQVKQRLNMAQKYLVEGLPKKLVAKKCFYSSTSAFSTAFKKEFGISPTEWENTARQHLTMTAIDTFRRGG
jgi:AraC-like DNA-binding protein